jgi:twitching motility protein PilT
VDATPETRTPTPTRGSAGLDELLQYLLDQRGSDLHVKVGTAPHVRIDGHLVPAPFEAPGPADVEKMAYAILPAARADEFATTNEADFALGVPGLGRFRVNVYRQRGTVAMVFRRVLPGIPTFDALGLPSVVQRLAEEPRGLVLVTGPTGSGKTTTIASMLDHINETRAVNVVTIEDPIEVLHTDKKALINQREIGSDTEGFAEAMRRVLRQDPDVIFIGEMRDPETVWAALAAAETGHLVLSTLHTANTVETVNRIVDFFPPHQHKQVRLSLATSLRGVISQRLLERADGRGRIPTVEVLVNTGRVFDRIVDPDVPGDSVLEIIEEGEYYGMQTFDQSLFALYRDGLVSLRDAMAVASNPHDFRIALQTAGLSAAF